MRYFRVDRVVNMSFSKAFFLLQINMQNFEEKKTKIPQKKNLNFKFENSKILWNLVSFFQNEHVKNCDKIIYV